MGGVHSADVTIRGEGHSADVMAGGVTSLEGGGAAASGLSAWRH